MQVARYLEVFTQGNRSKVPRFVFSFSKDRVDRIAETLTNAGPLTISMKRCDQ